MNYNEWRIRVIWILILITGATSSATEAGQYDNLSGLYDQFWGLQCIECCQACDSPCPVNTYTIDFIVTNLTVSEIWGVELGIDLIRLVPSDGVGALRYPDGSWHFLAPSWDPENIHLEFATPFVATADRVIAFEMSLVISNWAPLVEMPYMILHGANNRAWPRLKVSPDQWIDLQIDHATPDGKSLVFGRPCDWVVSDDTFNWGALKALYR